MESTGKFYTSNIPVQCFNVQETKPIDDRFVVHNRSDLLEEGTWKKSEEDGVYVYSGMTVSVVDDQTAENNGLYMLIDGSRYNKQAWDSSIQETYNVNGWRRIDGSSTTADVNMDENQFDGTGTQVAPYHVTLIDCGRIANTSN